MVRVGLVAAAVVGLGLGAWLALGRSSGSPAPTAAQELQALERAGRTAFVGEAGVSSDGVGWAMNGIGLWLTSDGGTHWRASSPSVPGGDVVARICDVDFVDAARGWLSGCDLIGDVFRNGSNRYSAVERTIDGGRTWKVSAADCAGCGGSLSFLDARTGFALTGWRAHRLARTADGGVTWHVVARAPFVGTIDFLDASHGWGVTWSARLFRTRDGGRTWKRVRFAGSGVQETDDLPRFFAAQDGVVAVRFRDAGSHVQRASIYVTSDGGRTWSARPAPAGVRLDRVPWGTSGSLQFSAATPRAWFLWDRDTLWSTSDAGAHWVRAGIRVAPFAVWNMRFTSPTTGWAIMSFEHGMVAALARTTNGGRDWSPLTPPVPKPPPPPKPITRCASSCLRP
jgi:photosystem II stability/assembly factor-like uncharacterized protein